MKKIVLVLITVISSLNALAFTDAEEAEVHHSACKDMTEQVEAQAVATFKVQTGIEYYDVVDVIDRSAREAYEDKFQTILEEVSESRKVELNKACQ